MTDPIAPPDSHLPPPAPAQPQPTNAADRFVRSPLVFVVIALAAVALVVFGQGRAIERLDGDLQAVKDSQHQLAVAIGELRGRAAAAPAVIDVANAPALGPENSVVTMIEFSDYECPYCIRYFQQTLPDVEKNYVNTGKIRYVFRDFPVDANHPQAIRAHEAAHCAIDQHKFWDIHGKLFSPPGTHTPALLEDRAKEAGLDLTAFRACIASGRTTAGIRESAALAEQLGADGTPAFFIGIRDLKTNKVRVSTTISGAQPYSSFAQALDAALAEAKQS